MRPDRIVAMAAYGDYGPGYIGTEIAYTQGGYETSQRASKVAPESERVLMEAEEIALRQCSIASAASNPDDNLEPSTQKYFFTNQQYESLPPHPTSDGHHLLIPIPEPRS